MSALHSNEDSQATAVDMPRLAGATVLDEAGVEHAMGTIWASQPALLVFVRHFG